MQSGHGVMPGTNGRRRHKARAMGRVAPPGAKVQPPLIGKK